MYLFELQISMNFLIARTIDMNGFWQYVRLVAFTFRIIVGIALFILKSN